MVRSSSWDQPRVLLTTPHLGLKAGIGLDAGIGLGPGLAGGQLRDERGKGSPQNLRRSTFGDAGRTIFAGARVDYL